MAAGFSTTRLELVERSFSSDSTIGCDICEFKLNTATYSGGSVQLIGSSLLAKLCILNCNKCMFENNTAVVRAVFSLSPSIRLIASCVVLQWGAAVVVQSQAKMVGSGMHFLHNKGHSTVRATAWA